MRYLLWLQWTSQELVKMTQEDGSPNSRELGSYLAFLVSCQHECNVSARMQRADGIVFLHSTTSGSTSRWPTYFLPRLGLFLRALGLDKRIVPFCLLAITYPYSRSFIIITIHELNIRGHAEMHAIRSVYILVAVIFMAQSGGYGKQGAYCIQDVCAARRTRDLNLAEAEIERGLPCRGF
ncbi:hypothetical protein C8R46DRAFT_1136461 [Mycena filopes]|nr:hypothetical protein C8R46DRAFT_1136461 [Mycena filopes]